MNGKLKVRISDNVLDKDDWTVWELTIAHGIVESFAAVEYEARGAYRADEFVGMTLLDLATWSRHDPTGSHPENYHEIRASGRWETHVNVFELHKLLDEGS